MVAHNIPKFFLKHEIFPSLDEEENSIIAAISLVQSYRAGDVIFNTADPSDFFYIIMEGSVQLNISGSEYGVLNEGDIFGEIGVINDTIRSGETKAESDCKLILVPGLKLFDEQYVPAKIALKIVRQMSKILAGYLVTREEATTIELIKRGEGEALEFKSTLRMNLHTGQKDQSMENAALKTIAAFINSKGGTLLIGVDDSGEILGLDSDRFPNDDKMLLHLTNLIKDKLGSIHLKFINSKVVHIEGKKVLRVDCRKTSTPAYFVSGNDEHFFIRTGPSTTSMKLSKVHTYILKRFGV